MKAVPPKELFPTAATSLLPHLAQEILSSSSCIKESSRISYYPQSLSDPMAAKTSMGYAEELGCSFGCEMLLGKSFGERRVKEGSTAGIS